MFEKRKASYRSQVSASVMFKILVNNIAYNIFFSDQFSEQQLVDCVFSLMVVMERAQKMLGCIWPPLVDKIHLPHIPTLAELHKK